MSDMAFRAIAFLESNLVQRIFFILLGIFYL